MPTRSLSWSKAPSPSAARTTNSSLAAAITRICIRNSCWKKSSNAHEQPARRRGPRQSVRFALDAPASSANRTLCRGPLLRTGCSCAFELFFQQLLLIQIRVIAAASEQFVVRATLSDGAVNQDNDLVGVPDRRGTVRNQNRRTAFHDSAQSGEDALLGLRVHGGKGIVEDQNSRIADDGARDRGALFLSTGESDAALADHGLVGLGEVLDVTVQAGNFGCIADTLLVILRQAEGDVSADGFA